MEKSATLAEFTWMATTLIEKVIFERSGLENSEVETEEEIAKLSFCRLEAPGADESSHVTIELRVLAPAVEPEQAVFVSGSIEELGGWKSEKAAKMSFLGESLWSITLEKVPFELGAIEYKYLIQERKGGGEVEWERGENRKFLMERHFPFRTSPMRTKSESSGLIDVKEMYGRSKVIGTSEVMRREVKMRSTGFAVPVFSLRSSLGSGVGEFLDLKILADICYKTGCRMIQILPVNDTSCFLNWRDSYPYSSLSVFALHPIYLRLQSLTSHPDIIRRIGESAKVLNELEQIDYEKVMLNKTSFIKEIFEEEYLKSKNASSTKASLPASSTSLFKSVKAFLGENKKWLIPYAVFVSLRDEFGTAEYSKWPEEYRKPKREEVERWFEERMEKESSGVERTCWVQYELHMQLKEASLYAQSKRVGLKGDLPIGVNRVSVDSWIDFSLFHMSMSTGAPPDQFSEDGQNWGFPTYDWDKMAEDGYSWWRQRLAQMAQYFHAFRIDHILGFFRIWEIPVTHASGMMGHYNPSIGIHRHELERQGLWDLNRLVEPFLRFDFVSSIADLTTGETLHLLDQIAVQSCGDVWKLKEQFTTSTGLETYLSSLPHNASSSWKDRFRKTVSLLQKNVILLRDPNDPDIFYPRVNVAKSNSFAELGADWRAKIWQLYVRYFYGDAQELYWRHIGSKRLPVIRSATKMLVCGEDLGMVPKCVEPVLNELGILGLRVQRMPPNPNDQFGFPSLYNHLSVCTTSSHDTSTLRGWWKEIDEAHRRAYSAQLFAHHLDPSLSDLSPHAASQILFQHLASPSMLAIFPIQDFFAAIPDLRVQDPDSEKINDPSNPSHYWRYRIHVSLEHLLLHQEFISFISKANKSCGRS